jgi:hypothetical protein
MAGSNLVGMRRLVDAALACRVEEVPENRNQLNDRLAGKILQSGMVGYAIFLFNECRQLELIAVQLMGARAVDQVKFMNRPEQSNIDGRQKHGVIRPPRTMDP